MTARNRIQLAAAFIVQLHRLSSNSPHSWRRAESVGRDIRLDGAAPELAIRDTEKAGFIQRRADNEGPRYFDSKGASRRITELSRSHAGPDHYCAFRGCSDDYRSATRADSRWAG